MKKQDVFGDEIDAKSEMDFASMLKQSAATTSRRVGDVFKGEILSIGKEQAFLATGTPTDGVLPRLELLDSEQNLIFKVGDSVEVRVLRVREGEIFLRRESMRGKGAAEVDSLADAYDMELPVEGKVLEVVKGGYRVQVDGVKAFCPVSQMDLRPGTDANSHINQKYEFIITQFDERGRNVVVSRRRQLERQKLEVEGDFLQKAKPGDLFQGEIKRLEKFGAFVMIENGLEGLIPISELAWGRLQNPSEVVSVGQKVQVLLLKIEDVGDRMRMAFSLKQAGGEGDPWSRVVSEFPVGTMVLGTVEKKESFGLFVQLKSGVSGLLPRSKWRDHVEGAQFENKKRGDQIQVMVDQIQFEEKRLTLGLPSAQEDLEWKSHAAATTAGGSKQGLGTFADLLKGFKPAEPSATKAPAKKK